jgi:hypothetical protein
MIKVWEGQLHQEPEDGNWQGRLDAVLLECCVHKPEVPGQATGHCCTRSQHQGMDLECKDTAAVQQNMIIQNASCWS